jgi:hypothetical protein
VEEEEEHHLTLPPLVDSEYPDSDAHEESRLFLSIQGTTKHNLGDLLYHHPFLTF